MQKPLLLMLLCSPVVVVAQRTTPPTPHIIATYPVTLHQQLSASCELIEAVTLIEYKQYDALASAGATDEIYSPELRKGDFVALSSTIPKNVAKSAKKSGYDVRAESTDPSGMSAKPMTKGGSCPDLQQAIADANSQRSARRLELQTRLHRLGRDILPPEPIEQGRPESVANRQVGQSDGKPKVREGAAIVAMAVGVEGKVQDVHVVQSSDVALGLKAIEAVRQWRFLPAQMNGLPVPVQIDVEFNFHLH